MPAPFPVRGRWALVTGASAGIGEEFARQLAARGAHVLLAARREERLRALAERIAADHGVRAEALPADLSRPGAAAGLWARATDGRAVDLLVNNAGFGAQGRFDELARERQVEMVQLNCTALLELAHLAVAHRRAEGGGGGIINVSSIAAFQPVPTLATYAASKAFVLSLSQALWSENRDAQIRVLALCPGRTPTEFQSVAGTGHVREGTFGYRTAAQVVDAALRALDADHSYVVPGAENYLATLLTRVMPNSVVTRAARRLVRSRAAARDGS